MWTEPTTMSDISDTAYDTLPNSAVKHFYDKLLKLKHLIHTPTAQRIAEQRHARMIQFLDDFFEEWQCDLPEYL